jgi:hypothetical protein
MPFPQQRPRLFTRVNLEAITPRQYGCYGLFKVVNGALVCVYIGKGDIRQRLLDHLNGDNPCVTRNRPTHWMDVVTNNMDVVEKQLIFEHRPICNERVG